MKIENKKSITASININSYIIYFDDYNNFERLSINSEKQHYKDLSLFTLEYDIFYYDTKNDCCNIRSRIFRTRFMDFNLDIYVIISEEPYNIISKSFKTFRDARNFAVIELRERFEDFKKHGDVLKWL